MEERRCVSESVGRKIKTDGESEEKKGWCRKEGGLDWNGEGCLRKMILSSHCHLSLYIALGHSSLTLVVWLLCSVNEAWDAMCSLWIVNSFRSVFPKPFLVAGTAIGCIFSPRHSGVGGLTSHFIVTSNSYVWWKSTQKWKDEDFYIWSDDLDNG